jgi:hypothetical protein
MRKRARRLWLGDWDRDQESTLPDTDRVAITPVDDEDAPLEQHPRSIRRGLAGGLAIALLCALLFALFSGGGDKPVAAQQSGVPPAQTAPPQTPQVQPQVPQGAPPQGFGGPDLTGPEAAKAAQAAVARYPGDVERVTRGPAGGGYVVHVIQADGNEVHVVVDDQFKVRGSDANSGPRNFGSGTPQ